MEDITGFKFSSFAFRIVKAKIVAHGFNRGLRKEHPHELRRHWLVLNCAILVPVVHFLWRLHG
jgi:hypothetical protein